MTPTPFFIHVELVKSFRVYPREPLENADCCKRTGQDVLGQSGNQQSQCVSKCLHTSELDLRSEAHCVADTKNEL